HADRQRRPGRRRLGLVLVVVARVERELHAAAVVRRGGGRRLGFGFLRRLLFFLLLFFLFFALALLGLAFVLFHALPHVLFELVLERLRRGARARPRDERDRDHEPSANAPRQVLEHAKLGLSLTHEADPASVDQPFVRQIAALVRHCLAALDRQPEVQ